MEMQVWLGFYREILSDFGFSEEADMASASLLNSLLSTESPLILEGLIRGREVNIFGAGPSLEDLRSIPDGVNIAADGACTFLQEKGVIPHMVVTDLDGRIDDIQAANREGAIIVLHAHGDNMEEIRRYAPSFTGAYGTTQTEPFGRLLNFGGFTDGDRAGFLAEHFRPRKITFYGMDFEGPAGRYSFTRDWRIKRKKLLWAKRLVQHMMETSEVEITLA
ncbi:MAG: DUF115 domain-containing protein [Methanobacteriota archaeon]|nr:MAG: DUF115 domain-containing protein [Euryarchaeota archaeon]